MNKRLVFLSTFFGLLFSFVAFSNTTHNGIEKVLVYSQVASIRQPIDHPNILFKDFINEFEDEDEDLCSRKSENSSFATFSRSILDSSHDFPHVGANRFFNLYEGVLIFIAIGNFRI